MTKASTETNLPSRGKPRQVSIPSQYRDVPTRWNVRSVRSALDEHDTGRFYASAALSDALLRDPQIMGDLATRVRALASRSALPFAIEVSDTGDQRKTKSIAKRIGELWWDCLPESTLAAVLRDSIMLGVAVGWIEWHQRGSEWVPELIPLPAHGLEWHSSDRKWTYTTDEGETLDVTPGDGTWFLHLPNGPRSWLQGAIRSLGMPWIMRVFAWRDWARWSEKHGLAILVIEEPYNAHDEVEGEAGSDTAAFYTQFKNLGSESTVRLPKGRPGPEGEGAMGSWGARFLEPIGNTWSGFRGMVSDLRAQITVALLGRDPASATSTGGDGASVLERVRVEYLASDAEPLSTSLRSQFWKPFVHFNVGANDTDATAWGRWNTRPPPDLAARATTLKAAAEAVALLEAQGIDSDPVVLEMGLVRRAGWSPPDLDAPPPVAPAPPAQPDPASEDAPDEAA